MNKNIRVLVTGAGGSPATNFVRSLRKAGGFDLVGTDSSKYYLMRAETDRRYLVPPASDPQYIAILNHIIEKENVDFIHAQNDVEVSFISEHRDEINAQTFLPSRETVKICQDKYLTYDRWQAEGLIVPDTVMINTHSDLENAFLRFGGKLWLRATQGAGGRGSLPATNIQTARSWIDFHDGWGTFTASELLSEHSVTWMSIWKNGELIVAQGRKRLYWELSKISASGVTGATGAGVTISDERLNEISIRAIKAIDKNPNGLFAVDLTLDSRGVPNPTEINIGRFFTTHQFFTELGVNMPLYYIQLAMGLPLSFHGKRINPAPDGMIWIRGMDFEPVLVSESEIRECEASLQNMKNCLAQGI